jgi:phosphotriesterase-related protein
MPFMTLTRRAFAASAMPLLAQSGRPEQVAGSILVHEHVLVDFIGADKVSRSRYDADEAFRAAKARLDELKPFGCVRFQECTPAYLGRDPRLLRRLEDATGLELWTNTGIYGAGNHRFMPAYAKDERPLELARRWIREFKDGVDGVRPRFIKTGVNIAPLHPWDARLVEAAAIASLETGLAICSHTTGGGRAFEAQVEILERMRAPLAKFVWVHAQNEKDHAYHERAARAGAWVEFDGIGEKTAAWHRDCVMFMRGRGLLHRTLISQDTGWYRVGEPGGGDFRPFTYIYTGFLPAIPRETWKPLLVDNPRSAFA